MIASDIRFAVGYARRSTDLQERSIPDQKTAVERWARDHGYRILRWFVDDAISGTSARGRDQFTRLIHEAENGRDFDAVLCYDMSRFSRGGTNETGYYLHRLRLAGVETHFTAEGIPDGDEGELLQGVKSWQARQYSVKLSRDSIRGQHSTVTVRNSAMGGRSPYGYDRQYVSANGQVLKTVRTLPDGRRQEFGPDGRHLRFIDPKEKLPKKMKSDIVRLVPGDPKHIAVVRDIFEMCVTGLGFRSILIALNAKGIQGPMHARWNQMAVKSILQNPCYRGALAWNRRTFGKIHEVASDGSAIPKKVAKTTRNPKDRWIVVENVHEAIVPPDLFWKAHEQMAKRRDAGGLARPTQRYLLSGLIRCKHCGHNFWGCVLKNSAGEIRYYADGGYRAQGIGVCKATHIQAAALDQWVLAQLRAAVLTDKTGVGQAIEQFVKAVCGRAAAVKAQPDRSRELADLNKRIKTTVALLSDSDLADVGELRAALVDLKRRREALEADVAAKPDAPRSIDPDRLRAWARERIADLGQALKPGTPMIEARAAVHAFVPKIEIDPDRKVGTLYLPRDACSALQAAFVRRETSASSSHSWMVLVAGRLASPRWSSSGVSKGLTMPMTSETSSRISGRSAPAAYVAFPLKLMWDPSCGGQAPGAWIERAFDRGW